MTIEGGKIGEQEIFFIPRHGKKHSIPPSEINYRANIYAAHKLEAKYLIATNAVGSLSTNFKIGGLGLSSNILDFTHGRNSTFFPGNDFEINLKSGKILSGVVHVDVSNIFDEEIRRNLFRLGIDAGFDMYNDTTIVVTNGPRFESPAEIKMYRMMGGDLVGMTTAPEVFLAKELEIPYVSIGVITNYGAGIQSSVSAEEVFDLFKKQLVKVKALIRTTIEVL